MMAEYIPLHKFKAIYVVDLCHSLCEQAKRKVQQKSWKNVHVVEADACTFQPPEGMATLVTFSYSLSSKPYKACFCCLHACIACIHTVDHVNTVSTCCSDSTIPLCH